MSDSNLSPSIVKIEKYFASFTLAHWPMNLFVPISYLLKVHIPTNWHFSPLINKSHLRCRRPCNNIQKDYKHYCSGKSKQCCQLRLIYHVKVINLNSKSKSQIKHFLLLLHGDSCVIPPYSKHRSRTSTI